MDNYAFRKRVAAPAQAGLPSGQQPPPAGYPPGQYPSPPPRKKDSSTVRIVILVAVLIIVVPVFLAIGWVAFSGNFVEPVSDRITVSLVSPTLDQRMISEEPYWTARMDVYKITPKDSDIPYEDVWVTVKGSDGSVLLYRTMLSKNNPDEYDDGSNGLVDVQVWYTSSSESSSMTKGDSIILTGLTSEYEGAHVEIGIKGLRLASRVLPTNFT